MAVEQCGATCNVAMLSVHSSPFGRLGTQDTGGMSVYVREMAKQLGESGHQVDIFTWRPSPDEPTVQVVSKNVLLVLIQPLGVHDKPEKEQLWHYGNGCAHEIDSYRQQNGREYQVIHSNYWISALLGNLLARRWRCPHVVSFHTLAAAKTAVVKNHRESEVRLAAEHRLMTGGDLLLAPTAAEEARYRQLGATNIVRVPCGVDIAHFIPATDRKKKETAELLFVGRFDGMKGVEVLLAALRTLLKRRPARLTLIGGDGIDSASHWRLQNMAEEFGVHESLRYLGPVPHESMADHYGRADCLVISSHYESFGLTVLEALACGVPVAATRVGISAEILAPGRNGWLAEPGDHDGLAEAVDQCLAIAQRAEPATIRATVTGFAWPVVAERLLDAYLQALQQREGNQET
ncbi:MAG: glycosyltransferase [Desulfofustis sp. PB-SRB1]|jgi:D-inositol-3-phosphate glycosyltransferase|nr:glycosyltransferase [Desulfofustis sp. PB-SRB1]MBM1002964.1 glycosyltransferase [Desulfofustis sp. PB-SRB1]HBH29967.1 hypothetical protein [Desulfofustis sp.]HBH32827.1 hypothetical protein [Desulfofustis sp.]